VNVQDEEISQSKEPDDTDFQDCQDSNSQQEES